MTDAHGRRYPAWWPAWLAWSGRLPKWRGRRGVASDRDVAVGFQRAILWAALTLLVWLNDPVTLWGLPREAWLAASAFFLLFFTEALERMEYGPRKRRMET